jgi:hypothetical protein
MAIGLIFVCALLNYCCALRQSAKVGTGSNW